MPTQPHIRSALLTFLTPIWAACASQPAGAPAAPAAPPAPSATAAEVPTAAAPASAHTIVPLPARVEFTGGAPFTLSAETEVRVAPGSDEIAAIGEQLAAILRPATGFEVPMVPAAGGTPGSIELRLGASGDLGPEGYELTVESRGITLSAVEPAGLFRGVQTLRQLLPSEIEAHVSVTLSNRPVAIPAGHVVDRPRFSWRGAMLDVSRHFFTVDEVKQYIDAIALYKINVLHLHLSDDQGWRVEIRSRPRLTEAGSLTEVGGGPGGFYTQEEYAEIVRYAAARYITIVPEIDLPGHTNAALIAFPELSCGTRPPEPYTGIDVGFSTFCVDNPETYALIGDVLRELAEMTPGEYLHVGGDEVEALTDEEYARFIERVQEIVTGLGKRMVGWEEIAKAELLPTTLVQQWKSDDASAAIGRGARVVLSPASRLYLDMKYDDETELGLAWAGTTTLREAYDWDPANFLPDFGEEHVEGVEAPLWSETLRNITAVQYMAFPRLPAIAELAWSPQDARDWEGFRSRIAGHAPRWRLLGIAYHPAPEVDWR